MAEGPVEHTCHVCQDRKSWWKSTLFPCLSTLVWDFVSLQIVFFNGALFTLQVYRYHFAITW